MFTILTSVWFSLFLYLAAAVQPQDIPVARGALHRSRRNIFQLCEVMEAYTPLNCWSFNNYGCFCGYGGEGSTPVDEIDRCCMVHDACYRSVTCWLFGEPHVVGYYVTVGDHSSQCTDSPSAASCAYQTCMCDVKFAECISKATYNATYKWYDRQKCK